MIKDLLKNNSETSITRVVLLIGTVACTLKLFLGGISYGSFSFAGMSGVEYGAAIAALGGIYSLRRHKAITPGGDGTKEGD